LGTERLGVLGGTFDPIHEGHLYIARSVQEIFSLSKILFVVAATPPHKPPKTLVDPIHRYAMVSLATAGERCFVPSPIELEPGASPYSVDTMSRIARESGQDPGDIYFIAGGDSLREVKSWRESEKLLTSYNFVFVLRPGSGKGDYREFLPEKAWPRLRDCPRPDPEEIRLRTEEIRGGTTGLFVVDIGAPDISATEIRQLAASGKDFSGSVPGAVKEYILKMQLYGAQI
jgi:nicotinate-nucleotide adenylyltransferase